MKPVGETLSELYLKPVTFRGLFTIEHVYQGTAFDSLFSADQHKIQSEIVGSSDKRKELWWLE